MKKLLIISMLFSLLIPFVGHAVVPSTSSEITDPEMNSELNDPAIDGHSSEDMWQDDQIGVERMEEQEQQEEAEEVDYNDRTRTERERKAINTSSNASDDK